MYNIIYETNHQSRSMQDTGCLGLVHWDDPEGWYGEGGGRRVQDGEHMYAHGRYIFMCTRDTCPLICLILASGAPRHLPADLPETRKWIPATPARSSA